MDRIEIREVIRKNLIDEYRNKSIFRANYQESVNSLRVSNFFSDPMASITMVTDAHLSTKQLAQTTIRNLLGTRTLTEIMSDRDGIAMHAQRVLNEGRAIVYFD